MENKLNKELILEGLNCASCASKIEMEVNMLEYVELANMNFITKTLIIKINDENKMKFVVDAAKHIINKLEPDVTIIEKDEKNSSYNYVDTENNKKLIQLIVGSIFFILAITLKTSNSTKFILYFISYIVVGGEVLLKATKNILRGQVFDENFLMSIATIGAFIIKEYPEGVAVMLFYQIGQFFQSLAVSCSRKSISELMDIRPDYANLKIGNKEKKVSPLDVAIGDYIIIKPGEKVPLDGIVVEGRSIVDTSALTGESVPKEVEIGSRILSGSINMNGLLTVEVKKEFSESTVCKVLELVENASSKKAPTENFITKFATYYTPIVVFIALALAIIPPLTINGASFSNWVYKALIFLVISCPCALVISIPLGFFGGIGGASKNGILVKGGNYLEALNNIHTVVFDKTGTLTKGTFKVTEINTSENISKDDLLKYVAHGESYSSHPIAISILKAYGKEINKEDIEDYEELAGYGVMAKVKGKEILAGNSKLMREKNIVYEPVETIGTVVYVVIDGQFAGSIIICDEIKEDSKNTIKQLKAIGVNKVVMLTGDNKDVAKEVATKLEIDEVYSELLPNEKVEKVELLSRQKSPNGKLVFVGDGINDAPVLARADVGVAMGGLGSHAAIEAADIVLMTDEPIKLVNAIKIAKRTKNIVWQNIIFALSIKAIVLILGAGGIATMWEAVFADVGVALIAVFNAMRAMNIKDI